MRPTMRRGTWLTAVALCAIAASCTTSHSFDSACYPAARRGDTVDVMHGVTVADPYRWLEDEQNAETQAWVRQQNALTHETLARFKDIQHEIAQELEAVYGVFSVSNLYPHGARRFFSKRTGLENHAKLYATDGDYRSADAHVVIDPNKFSADGTVSLDWWFPSPDGRLIAYGKSASGSEKSTLYIRDTETGRDLDDVIPFTQYCNVAWDADGSGFYYNRSPDPMTVPAGEENFHMRVYFHKAGTDYANDRYVWGKDRPIDEEPRPYASSDHRYVMLNFYRDPSEDELYFGAMNSTDPLRPIAEGLGAITEGDVVDGRVYLRTNYQAPRFRICTAAVDHPTPEHWQDLIPQQKGVIDALRIVDHKLVVRVSEDVHSRLMIYGLDGKFIEEVPLPGIGTVSSFQGGLDKPSLYFTFSSWVVPTAVYQYDLRTAKLVKLHQRDCPVDLSSFTTKQIWCTSKDGVRVPMFVVARKDVELTGDNPTLLYAYGGFM